MDRILNDYSKEIQGTLEFLYNDGYGDPNNYLYRKHEVHDSKTRQKIVAYLLANDYIYKESNSIFKLTRTGHKVIREGGIKEYLEKERQKEKQSGKVATSTILKNRVGIVFGAISLLISLYSLYKSNKSTERIDKLEKTTLVSPNKPADTFEVRAMDTIKIKSIP